MVQANINLYPFFLQTLVLTDFGRVGIWNQGSKYPLIDDFWGFTLVFYILFSLHFLFQVLA